MSSRITVVSSGLFASHKEKQLLRSMLSRDDFKGLRVLSLFSSLPFLQPKNPLSCPLKAPPFRNLIIRKRVGSSGSRAAYQNRSLPFYCCGLLAPSPLTLVFFTPFQISKKSNSLHHHQHHQPPLRNVREASRRKSPPRKK